jgi:hypothetical protein
MSAGGQVRLLCRSCGGVELKVAEPAHPARGPARIFDPSYHQGQRHGLRFRWYGIVERHGGRLEVKSEVGQGTVMRIRLPLSGARTAVSAAV